MTVGAGGAVTVQSDPEAEFAEMQLKAERLLMAAAVAQQQQHQQPQHRQQQQDEGDGNEPHARIGTNEAQAKLREACLS